MAAKPPTTEIERAKVCALLNARYHADREAWYDGWHRILMSGVIIGGSGALLDILWPWTRGLASFAVVIFGTIDLVFSLSDRARKHGFLRKRYLEVAADLERPRANARSAQAEMMLFSAEEDPPYYAVHALAENWATRAILGSDVELPCRIGWFRRLFRHVWRFDEGSFSC